LALLKRRSVPSSVANKMLLFEVIISLARRNNDTGTNSENKIGIIIDEV